MKPIEKEIIVFDDPKAARFVENIKGWVDINNRFFGDMSGSEDMARYSSCTHKRCECGGLMTKGWLKCEKCRAKIDIEKYNALPFKEYDESVVYSHYADEYFFDSDSIEDYCADNDCDSSDLRLVFCDPNMFDEVNCDIWSDILPEDEDSLPVELINAVEELNKIIRTLPPASFSPGKVRTIFKNR